MIKQVLAGAAFATAATMAVAAPASAQTTGTQAQNTPTNTLQSVLTAPLAQGPTAIGNGATDFVTRNGDTAITGNSGGLINSYGAPLAHVDGRCAAPMPEGEGIGGHALGTLKAECGVVPVDQYQAPQKLL
ncbi:hypothetical protein [Streptomyces sp. NPDC050485]|uniref:hypothetical protein n=1 Tax=Streptomyces sp. NPDC050485 TaxID=3365617 RepID=UPI00379B9B3B